MAVHKLRHFFCTISDHYLPLCHLLTYSPLPPTRWRNLWTGKWHIHDRLFCKTQPYCLCIFFILEQFLMPVRGMVWLDCYISVVRVLYSGVSVFSLLTPASSSLSVIFCKTPSPPLCYLVSSFGIPLRTPWLDDVIYEQPLRDYQKLHFDTITYTVL